MSEEARETNSVTDLKHQLQQLQEEVDEASEVSSSAAGWG